MNTSVLGLRSSITHSSTLLNFFYSLLMRRPSHNQFLSSLPTSDFLFTLRTLGPFEHLSFLVIIPSDFYVVSFLCLPYYKTFSILPYPKVYVYLFTEVLFVSLSYIEKGIHLPSSSFLPKNSTRPFISLE